LIAPADLEECYVVGHTGERNADTVATWALPEPSGLPAAPSFDATRPNTARAWSYQRGGNGCKNAFAADREAAEVLNAAMREIGAPDVKAAARENRAVLRRFVRYLSATGIRQFLDLGCGLPIHGSGEEVHEIVQRTAPGSRVVYVDIDPLVVVHGRALLANGTDVTVMQADLRQPQQILDQVRNKRLLDLDEPVAVLVVAVLHCLSDREDPGGVVAQLREAVVPGSCLALTHLTTEAHPEGARLLQIKAEELGMSTPLVPRPREEITHFFDGFELARPGLVYAELWRPEVPATDSAGAAWMLAGIGRKQT
jgi:SAM-dependent methyltransferase